MVTRASIRDLRRLRLERHGLAGDAPAGPLAVVERLLAVQAQDLAAARWALGVRAPGSTVADVDAALAAGTIVRSWPMRGTLHIVPARELGWMQQLTTPRLLAGARTRNAQLDLDEATFARAREVAVTLLTGGNALSRAAFLAELESRGVSTAGARGYHIIGRLAQTGTLCWGPPATGGQALVLLDEWVPHPRLLERDEALGEFLLRYLHGHGPATLKDFAWWAQLTVADARVGLMVAGENLTRLDVEGVPHYFPAAADLGQAPARQRCAVFALPGFDEYFLGYQDRSPMVTAAQYARVVPGKNGIFLPVLVCAGRIIGTWRRQASAGRVTAEAAPFDSFGARRQAGFARSMGDYARFLGTTVSVRPMTGPGLT